jgi:hypothetical protein
MKAGVVFTLELRTYSELGLIPNNPSTQESGQEGHKFEANLGYMQNSVSYTYVQQRFVLVVVFDIIIFIILNILELPQNLVGEILKLLLFFLYVSKKLTHKTIHIYRISGNVWMHVYVE